MEEKKLEKYKKAFARIGGNAKLKKYGRDAYVEMGRKSGEARRKKKELQDT